jgi:lipopolysaccharide transport system permease protein
MKAAVSARPSGDSLATTSIRPSTGWTALRLGDLWAYRELLYFFVWRDVKVRYKQTAFGALWAIIQPLTLMAVFTVVLGRIAGITPEGVPYALFALTGLVPWTLFSQSLIGSSNSLVSAADLLQKVYFPRLLLPVSATGSYLIDYAISFSMLIAFMLLLGVAVTPTAIWVIPLTVLLLATALGVGIWLSAINVRYRDVRHATPFLVQVWFFASPIAYPTDFVPEGFRNLYYLNPMAGVIEGFRWALLGQGSGPPTGPLLASVLVTGVVLISGLMYFRRVERTFADVI